MSHGPNSSRWVCALRTRHFHHHIRCVSCVQQNNYIYIFVFDLLTKPILRRCRGCHFSTENMTMIKIVKNLYLDAARAGPMRTWSRNASDALTYVNVDKNLLFFSPSQLTKLCIIIWTYRVAHSTRTNSRKWDGIKIRIPRGFNQWVVVVDDDDEDAADDDVLFFMCDVCHFSGWWQAAGQAAAAASAANDTPSIEIALQKGINDQIRSHTTTKRSPLIVNILNYEFYNAFFRLIGQYHLMSTFTCNVQRVCSLNVCQRCNSHQYTLMMTTIDDTHTHTRKAQNSFRHVQ